jgi:hypothetical protein
LKGILRFRCHWGCHLALAGLLTAAMTATTAVSAARQSATSLSTSPNTSSSTAPSAVQVAAIVARATLNQHRDDAALEEYEFTERVITRGRDGASSERISRVVPHGWGNFRVELAHDGMPTAAAAVETQWRDIAEALASYSNPANEQRVKQDRDKAAKLNRQRDQLEDAIGKAFRFHWVGRTMQGQRAVVELSFEPDPAFKPSVRFSNLYQHVRGTAWVDESSGQVTRVEAELFEDVPFVGGLVAKLNRGGKLIIEQSEVAPDVWAPTHYSIDLDGRKFLSGFSLHQQIDMSAHLRVGQPQETLTRIERDHPGLISGAQ